MQKPERDLKEACVAEALAIIESEGLERLSLRDVARRLGVSHQAPYRHFPSRDHILAEIVARAFGDFALYLDAHPKSDDPDADMRAMGEAYLRYAEEHPLQYRLMFGAALPDGGEHPEMMARARHAFDLLLKALRRKAALHGALPNEDEIVLDAVFIWSSLHGLASLRNSSAFATLRLKKGLADRSRSHLFMRFAHGLSG